MILGSLSIINSIGAGDVSPWNIAPVGARHLVKRRVSPRGGLIVNPTLLVAGFWICTLALLSVGLGSKVRFAWPVIAMICGWFLLEHAPRHYISFAWLLWFFTPFVRRVVDMGAWSPFNPCMLAPPLVTALCIVHLLRRSYLWRRPEVLPFLMIIAGGLYAYARGIGTNGLLGPSYDALEWIVPPSFAAFLVIYRDKLGLLERTLQTTFAIGVFVMGVYGVLQFISPMPWDVYWMQNVPMASNGQPLPYQVRVFSTMNSPGPFSLIMMAGVLLVPAGRSKFRWLAAGPGGVSLLLSLVRAAWGGFVVGLIATATLASGAVRSRLIIVIVALVLVGLPLLTIGPVADTISVRMNSFESIQSDNSLNVRIDLYVTNTETCLLNIFGAGLGSTGTASKLQNANGALGGGANFDSGVLNIPFVLGWPGAILYVGGVVTLLMRVLRTRAVGRDMFLCTCAGIAIGALGQMVFINTLIGVQGMVFWTFLGVCLGGSMPVVCNQNKVTATTARLSSPKSGRGFMPTALASATN
jgi:hypothetical protein